ncbi:MazG nucleotide pyrophosphohydrolase domain-containing protein [Arthrobacter sp. SX1312]|uniref:MazG nucleotide pyrophosphohydrolase domain-containing protein n=1 Tax=Arthrobacter sp. SX1312 TaxID=2058896 RepID=UPI002157D42E|nr:MazG nucleotide pyrophosphohydrolase domain-containing protein [Arthrobacter sp. SX1312]
MEDAAGARDAAPGNPPGAAVERLVEVVALLRRHCPWTAALDHAALLGYLVEETYELYEAVDDVSRAGTPERSLLDELRGELGDVLFQVVLHAQLRAEAGSFGLAEVAEGLTDKLVRRNPHVFATDGSLRAATPGRDTPSVDGIVAAWQAVKAQERPARTSPFDGIPHRLPALAFAAKTLGRAGESSAGEDRPEQPQGVVAGSEADLGLELLALVRRALGAGIDPERALRRAVLDYQRDVRDGA